MVNIINLWLRYNNFWFGKTNVRHIGNLLSVSISTIWRNLPIILHQPTEFRPNRSTHCGNMTSNSFLKMAAATAEYYFRFRICWCYCLQKVKKLLANQMLSRYLKWRLRYNYLWQSKMAWEGVKFFSKSRMCQYPGTLCYILWIQKIYAIDVSIFVCLSFKTNVSGL